MSDWKKYINYLDEGSYSVRVVTSNLTPQARVLQQEKIVISELGYTLWPFQKQILHEMGESTLILGLPTGLGKTYVAGAKLHEESKREPIRVLFLVPSVPLGVQQTLFAREKLGVKAFFVSGGISPDQREKLKVWNNGFIVATPQTFYNDNLNQYEACLQKARGLDKPEVYLSQYIKDFPFDIVVADECQRYIGETDGYSTLLAARAYNARILALSATPQLHAPQRLQELKKVFSKIETFGVNDPGIREHMPERLLVVEQLDTPTKLLKVYYALGELVSIYHFRISKMYGSRHPRNCTRHKLCRAMLAIRMLRMRLVEDGASSVKGYKTWRFRDLRNKRSSLNGETIWQVYKEALGDSVNHKLDATIKTLSQELYQKAIVYVESVEAAKELASKLQKKYSLVEVACLVGKSDMSMDQQASALLHFREAARILICTSVGEEGLDIPSADLEVWVDPPSNPRKWIQRFGRILRQPGDKKIAKTIALVNTQTHEKIRLLSVKKKVEKTYGFTQRMETRIARRLPEEQRTMIEFLKP